MCRQVSKVNKRGERKRERAHGKENKSYESNGKKFIHKKEKGENVRKRGRRGRGGGGESEKQVK